jgi:hypothetical protein
MTPSPDTPDPADLREQLVPYVLGELEGAELERLEAALLADPALAAELAEIERTTLDLAAAVPQHPAPPALRGRVLDAIAAAAEHDARTAPRRAAAAATPSWRERLAARLTPGGALAGGFALAACVLGILLLDARSSLEETRSQLAQARGTAANATQMVSVQTTDRLAGASGHLMRDGDRLVLVLEDLPSAGDGSWQIWTADRGGTVRNVGMWTGDGPTQAIAIDGAKGVTEVMVSREQTRQRLAAPSSSPVAAAKVS